MMAIYITRIDGSTNERRLTYVDGGGANLVWSH